MVDAASLSEPADDPRRPERTHGWGEKVGLPAAEAPLAGKVWQIGLLSSGSPAAYRQRVEALRPQNLLGFWPAANRRWARSTIVSLRKGEEIALVEPMVLIRPHK